MTYLGKFLQASNDFIKPFFRLGFSFSLLFDLFNKLFNHMRIHFIIKFFSFVGHFTATNNFNHIQSLKIRVKTGFDSVQIFIVGCSPNLDVGLCIVGVLIFSCIRKAGRQTISYLRVPLGDRGLQANPYP